MNDTVGNGWRYRYDGNGWCKNDTSHLLSLLGTGGDVDIMGTL